MRDDEDRPTDDDIKECVYQHMVDLNMKELEEKTKDHDRQFAAYCYLCDQDEHIGRLIDWIGKFAVIREDVAISEQDTELEDKILDLINSLTHELGFRVLGAMGNTKLNRRNSDER